MRYFSYVVLVAFSLGTIGCNLFGRLDNPGELRDKYALGLAQANAGLCDQARDTFISIGSPTNDDVLAALGWAYLCLGNAQASNIAASIYKFTGNSTDYTVIGLLARTMNPWTTDKQSSINLAISTFGQIGDSRRRGLLQAIGDFSLAAIILTKQGAVHGDSNVHQTDVAPAACSNDSATCGTSANCTGPAASGSGAGMNDTDTVAFINAISAASTALGSTNAGDLTSLAAALNAGLAGGLAVPNIGRCFIFNKVVPNP